MTRQFWYVRDFIGQRAQVKLVDFSSRGWGHINFDDLEGDITCSNLENTGIYLLQFSRKLFWYKSILELAGEVNCLDQLS